MDSKFIKPSLFGADPNAGQASEEWKHWYRTFTNFLESFPAVSAITEQEKLSCLVAHIDKDVYSYISECASYNDAMSTLEGLYVKPCNFIFDRHLLMTCKQQTGQSLDDFLQKLRQRSRTAIIKPSQLRSTVTKQFVMHIFNSYSFTAAGKYQRRVCEA